MLRYDDDIQYVVIFSSILHILSYYAPFLNLQTNNNANGKWIKCTIIILMYITITKKVTGMLLFSQVIYWIWDSRYICKSGTTFNREPSAKTVATSTSVLHYMYERRKEFN